MRYDSQKLTKVALKIGVGLIALLFLLNSAFLYLFVKEKKKNRDFARTIKETGESLARIETALSQKNFDQTMTYVSDARKKVMAPAIPARTEPVKSVPLETRPAPAGPGTPAERKPVPVETAKKATAPLERTVKLDIPPASAPVPLISADAGEHVLVCEKDTKTLHTFRFIKGHFLLVKSYPCIVGANGGDKKKAGDFATPKGIYFVQWYTPGTRLRDEYGAGAFALNYPNLMDRKEGKRGSGIWLHGHSTNKDLNDIQSTKGCIAVGNEAIKELAEIVKPQYTPVAIVDKLQFGSEQNWQNLSRELKAFLDGWKHSWEAINTKKYLTFYAPDFVNNDGMNFSSFKSYKEKVNKGKKSIRVKIERPAMLLSPEQDGKMAVVRFDQKYQSNNFKSDSKKVLYLRKGKSGWQIIGESAL
jgi:murein L,D-transpeptidase YafK